PPERSRQRVDLRGYQREITSHARVGARAARIDGPRTTTDDPEIRPRISWMKWTGMCTALSIPGRSPGRPATSPAPSRHPSNHPGCSLKPGGGGPRGFKELEMAPG